MIYTNQARAKQVANDLNRNMPGWGTHRAARIAEGWTVRRFSPYSNGDVLEWAN